MRLSLWLPPGCEGKELGGRSVFSGPPRIPREFSAVLGSLASVALSPDGDEAPVSGHFGESGLDVFCGGGLGARKRGGQEGVVGEEIDLPGQPRGGLEESLLCGGIE